MKTVANKASSGTSERQLKPLQRGRGGWKWGLSRASHSVWRARTPARMTAFPLPPGPASVLLHSTPLTKQSLLALRDN